MISTNVFAKRLKQVRKNMGLTQKEMSELVGVTQANLCTYERGRNTPGLQNLLSIAVNCNVSLDWLCGVKTGSQLEDVARALDHLAHCGKGNFTFEVKVIDATEKMRCSRQ